MRKLVAIAVVAGSMAVGGVAGALVFGASSATAQSSAPASPSRPAWPDLPRPGWPGPFGPGFGPHEAVWDLSVAAKAIGVSEADLVTALRGGSSIAAVAKQHGVAVQKVIDALVADARSRLAAAVKAGRITQSQAVAIAADLPQRIAERVNAPGFDCGPGHPGAGIRGHGWLPGDGSEAGQASA